MMVMGDSSLVIHQLIVAVADALDARDWGVNY